MKRLSIAALLVCGMLFSVATSVVAQGPIRSETHYAGVYKLRIDFYSDPPFTGRQLVFGIVVRTITGDPIRGLTVAGTAIPEVGTNASTLRANVKPGSSVGGFQGDVTMQVRGSYRLWLTISGPAGTSAVDLPLRVAAPTAIPVSVAWLIGLAPLLGLIGFGARQRSYLARLRVTGPMGAGGASGPGGI